MATGYSRKAVFIDGDIILAEHGNLEFDALVQAFNATTGHSHDGTQAGGAPVPLLKDLTLSHDFKLDSTGVSGTVVSTDPTLAADNDKLLSSQKAIKTYVDQKETESISRDDALDFKISEFANSNHGHTNYDQINHIGYVQLKNNENFEAHYGYQYRMLATAPNMSITLEAFDANYPGRIFVLTNSKASTHNVTLPVTKTIRGAVTATTGDNIIITPGVTLYLVDLTATDMEVL